MLNGLKHPDASILEIILMLSCALQDVAKHPRTLDVCSIPHIYIHYMPLHYILYVTPTCLYIPHPNPHQLDNENDSRHCQMFLKGKNVLD